MSGRHPLTLEDVSFTYSGAVRQVFEHLNLTLRAGETTALAGVHGAGKTTLDGGEPTRR